MSVYELIDKISKLQAEGKDLIRLDIGQPDLPVPDAIKEATKRAIDENKTRYTHSKGIPELREAVASLHNVQEENVIITAGGKFPIYSTFQNVTGKTTIVRPCWGAYPLILNKFNKEFDVIDTTFEDRFKPSFESLDNASMVVINYPNNPTGVSIGKEEFNELSDYSNDASSTILSDEVYTKMTFKKTYSITEFDCDYICIGSFSKTFSMTGYRLGYAIASEENIKKIQEAQQLSTTSPPDFAQHAGLEALGMIDKVSADISEFYSKRRDEALSLLDEAGFEVIPSDGTFYLFPRLDKGMDANKYAMKLLDNGVSVLPGSPFGPYDSHFRISLVTDQMEKAVSIMKKTKDSM